MRVIVTGSRKLADRTAAQVALYDAIAALPVEATLIEGGAMGTDEKARIMARRRGLDVETYWANWTRYDKGAGPIRNQKMLSLGADLVLAFPGPESKGTWDMVRIAQEAGIKVEVLT